MTRIGNVRYHQGNWRIEVRHNGHRVYRTVRAPDDDSGRRQAEAACALLVRQLTYGGGDLTLSEVIDMWTASKSHRWSKTGSTVRTARVVKRECGDVLVRRLNVQTIEATHRRWLNEGLAPGTVVARHCIVRAALNEAVRLGLLDYSPAALVKLPKVPRPNRNLPDLAEVSLAIDRIEHTQMRLAARLGLATGARCGEILALQWKDIDLTERSVRFVRNVVLTNTSELVYQDTKTGEPKHLALDQYTLADLADWKRSDERAQILGGDYSPWVFLSTQRRGHSCRPGALHHWWRRDAPTVGLGHMKFHGLRHLHATAALASGIHLPSVSARLGHSTPRTTLGIYSHAVPSHDRAIADYIERSTVRDGTGTAPARTLAATISANAAHLGHSAPIEPSMTIADLEQLAGGLNVDVRHLLEPI